MGNWKRWDWPAPAEAGAEQGASPPHRLLAPTGIFMPLFPRCYLLRSKKPKQAMKKAEIRLFSRSTQEGVFVTSVLPNKPTPGRSDCTRTLWWDSLNLAVFEPQTLLQGTAQPLCPLSFFGVYSWILWLTSQACITEYIFISCHI